MSFEGCLTAWPSGKAGLGMRCTTGRPTGLGGVGVLDLSDDA